MISIIIPTFNRKALLEKCLKSIEGISSAGPEYEVIVVDDGSTDDTAYFLALEMNTRKNLRFFRQKNNGPAAARNRGAREAAGEILAFTDDDCLVSPGWITAITQGLADLDAVAVEGPVMGLPENRKELVPLTHWIHREKAKGYMTCNLAVRKSAFDTIDGFDRRYRIPAHEDADLCLQLLRIGKIGFSPDMVVRHPPRKMQWAKEIRDSSRYARGFVESEYLFYLRNRSEYRSVRYRASFYSTLTDLCFKLALGALRTHGNSGLRHPIQFLALIGLRLLQQFFLAFWFAAGISRGFRPLRAIGLFSGSAEASALERIGKGLAWNAQIPEFFLPRPILKTSLRKIFGRPVYRLEDGKNLFKSVGQPDPGAARFLLRVDDFPCTQYSSEVFADLHDVIKKAGVPYLLGVTPQPAINPMQCGAHEFRELSQKESDLIKVLKADGVEFGFHGFHHQRNNPYELSETAGFSEPAMESGILQGLEVFERLSILPRIYIPPFNALDLSNFRVLSEHFSVICGGPETVRFLGYGMGPIAMGWTWYIPSYFPFYGPAQKILGHLKKWDSIPWFFPICVHWDCEAQNSFRYMKELVNRIAGQTAPWSLFTDRPGPEGSDHGPAKKDEITRK